jgi:hypothetical protein
MTAGDDAMQTARIRGNRNILVQIAGDGNAVTLRDQPHLELLARHRRKREPAKPLDLLNTRTCPVPLIGRDAQMADLRAWLAADRPISVRCLTGGAGAGKTRLAQELCATADADGWFAGFVTLDELERFAGLQNLSAWGWARPTPAVIDYAAAKVRALRRWLEALAENQSDTEKPLRLLLLERHGARGKGWWRELAESPSGWAVADLPDLFDPPVPEPLGLLASVDERQAILQDVMTRAAQILTKPSLAPPAAGSDAAFEARLASDAMGEPLTLLMAGIYAVDAAQPSLLTLGRIDLAEYIAKLELARVEKLATSRGLNAGLLRWMAAGVTLAGGAEINVLQQVIGEEAAALGIVVPDLLAIAAALEDALPADERMVAVPLLILGNVPEVIAQAARRALDDAQRAHAASILAPMVPDLIGEAAVFDALRRLPPTASKDLVLRWYGRAPASVIETLIRTAQDYAQDDSHPVLAWFDACVAAAEGTEALGSIADQIPERTLNFPQAGSRGRETDHQFAGRYGW